MVNPKIIPGGGRARLAENIKESNVLEPEQQREHDLHEEPIVPPSPSETRIIVLESSTLYVVWDHPMPSNCVYFDIDFIMGGKVRDMTSRAR